MHSSLEKAEAENQKLIDTLMHRDKEFREIEIINASLSGEIQTLKLKIECLQNEEDILKQNVNLIKVSSNHLILRTLKITRMATRIIPQQMKVTRILCMSLEMHFCSTLNQNGF